MPRLPRLDLPGVPHHVLNRGNRRAKLFDSERDYADFLGLLGDALDEHPVSLNAFSLMSNHWHLLLTGHKAGALSAYIQEVANRHVRRIHQRRGTTGQGHIYQDRFKSFPIEDERHLFVVMRYVEANPVRAGLVGRAEEWAWSSVSAAPPPEGRVLIARLTGGRPRGWVEMVNDGLPESDLQALRQATRRSRPFGSSNWSAAVAVEHGFEAAVRPRGRPRVYDGPMPD